MSSTAPSEDLINVQIDGVWKQFPKGTRLIEACKSDGKPIPHYCYHPKLSSPGNCRMCMVEMGMPKMGPDRKPELGEDGRPVINWIPRPQISCAQTISEGMGVRTNSLMVQEARHGVMEFLLINHPLDCPICDQAGECRLQEFSVEYGNSDSRFLDDKVKKPKKVEIGARVMLDDERCILCSRCVRFTQEIAHEDVLGFVNRGSYNTLTCHPGKALDHNYSLNTVDICPVGALTSDDFRFKMRVWFLKETKSICTSCGTGCNTVIGSREDKIYRQTPRENDDVNSCWMCDYGRLNFHYLDREDRLKVPQSMRKGVLGESKWTEAIESAADLLKKYPVGEVAIVASGSMTNEEMFMLRRLATALQVQKMDIVPHPGVADGILMCDDRNSNTNGARILKVSAETPGALLTSIVSQVNEGKIKAVLVIGEDPLAIGITEKALKSLPALVVLDILPNEATPYAEVVLPGSGFAEKRGSMVNFKGRLQRLNRAVNAPGQARDDWEILRDLVQAVNGQNGIYTVEELFKEMAKEVPAFHGLTLAKISDQGVLLEAWKPVEKLADADAPENETSTAETKKA